MNLSPRQLKIFVALAHSLNFSRTAEQLHVTQPRLSKIVREIEDSFGVRLFDRTTRSVTLTANGAALLAVATRLMANYELGMAELADVAARDRRRLAIAALPTLAAMMLPEAMAALRREHPDASLRVHDVLADVAIDLLRTRKVDMALTALDGFHPDLQQEEIMRDRFVLLSSKRHPPPWQTPPEWSEVLLGTLPLISMPRGSSTRQIIDASFVRENMQFRPVFEISGLAAIARFVKAGCGMALLPELGAELVLDPELAIIPLRHAPERTIGIVMRQGEERSALALRIVQAMRAFAKARRSGV